MKKFVVIAVTIFSLSGSLLFAQSGWQWVNPYTSIHNISNIKFFNNSTGYAKINRFLYRTTDEGNSWKMTDTASGYAYSFINANTGFSEKDGVVKTTNGGLNWFPYGVSYWISSNAMAFLNESTGIVAAANYTPLGVVGVLYATTNSGVNWSYKYLEGLRVYDFKFVNSNMVIAATIDSGKVSILKSYNPFNNWQKIKSDIPAYNYISICIPDSTAMFIMVDNYMKNEKSPIRFYKSTNGGNNWFNTGIDQIYDTEFLDANTGIAVGANGNIYRTINKGDNWTGITSPVNYDLLSVNFINSSTGYISGRYGAVLKTIDGGFNWSTNAKKFTSASLGDLAYTGRDTIIVVGYKNIYRTTNQGLTWESRYSGDTINFRKVFFIDKNTGYAAGEFGKLCKTTNNGKNWTSINTGFIDRFMLDITFINQYTGFISTGYNGHIYKTTNEGMNWAPVTNPREGNFFFIKFYGNVGYTGSFSNNIFRTTNYGENWTTVLDNPATSSCVMDLTFINSNTGFATLNDGHIYKSTNSGLNWFDHLQINWGCGLYNINFINENTGYLISGIPIGGGRSEIFCTTNGGNNWVNQPIPFGVYPATLNSVVFLDANTGFAVGDSGVVLKTTTGGFVGLHNISVEIPSTHYLSQNYPNPFNPSTNVKFSIVKAGDVKIVIYDVMGREVQTLVNERLNAGTYEVKFDGSMLTSGVYFYKMVSEGFTETKRMVLIK